VPLRIGCVVEGHGEVESIPVLIRRIAHEFDPALPVVIPRPVRVTKSKLLKSGELERATALAALNAGRGGGLLIVLDSDEDCPAQLGPELLERVRLARADMPSACGACPERIRVLVPGVCRVIARMPGITGGPPVAG
jgi:hypothetical protein